jgi:integrase
MNKPRKTGKGLPKRVYLKNGAYRFFAAEPMRNPKNGKMQKWIHLAYEHDGESEMFHALAKLLGNQKNIHGTMPYLCAEFKANELPRNDWSEETKAQYSQYLEVISKTFEEFHAEQVTTKDCADFLRVKFKGKNNTTLKYAALLKKVFQYAKGGLGLISHNPMADLDMSYYKIAKRDKLPTHDQVAHIRKGSLMSEPRKDNGKQVPTPSGPMFCCLVDMAYLCWQRAIDVRTLKEEQIKDGRMSFKPSKTAKTSGKAVDITVTPSIQSVIDKARAIKRKYGIISPYLMPNQKGKPYTKSGLLSMWVAARERAGIEEKIWFRDLRPLGATDAAKRGEHIKTIQTRLAHTSERTSAGYVKAVVADKSELEMELPWGMG